MEIFKYDIGSMKTGVCSMNDFYARTHLIELMRAGLISDVAQIWMNRKNCDILHDSLYESLRKSRKYKDFTDKYLRTSSAMDWLNYAPVGIEWLPEDEIWVWETEEATQRINVYRDKKYLTKSEVMAK